MQVFCASLGMSAINRCDFLPYCPVSAKGLGVPCVERLGLPARRRRSRALGFVLPFTLEAAYRLAFAARFE